MDSNKLLRRKSSKKVLEEERRFSGNPEDNVYLLELNEKGEVDILADQYLHCPNFSRIIIKLLNGSPVSKNCSLITNYGTDLSEFNNLTPLKKGDRFEHLNRHLPVDVNTSVCFQVDLTECGSCFFQISYEDTEGNRNFCPEFWIVVDPYYKLEGKFLDLTTILSKSLGKIDNWEKYYKEASSLHYNFVHFTPVQPTGTSESLYCLDDQTDINDAFFSEKLSKQEKYQKFEDTLLKLQDKYQILGIVDVVLNHCSHHAQWLYDNPDSGYNLVNSPHLTSAFILDDLLLDFSDRYSKKKVPCSAAPYINNENDLNSLMAVLSGEIRNLRLEEYFLINVGENVEKLKKMYCELKALKHNELKDKKILVEEKYKDSKKGLFDLILENCSNHGAAIQGVEVNHEIVGLLLFKQELSEKDFINEFLKHVNKINDLWRGKAYEFVNQAIQNVRSTIQYEFIQMKHSRVTDKKRLVENYFSPWNNQKHDKSRIWANNGWLFGSNEPTANFAIYGQGNWDYLRRGIVIWGDCAKLRYGEKPEDSPFLWQHMTTYVENMARCFNGFRLDNAHSTPIWLAQYLINVARKVNPNLLIVAELFAGSKEREIDFVKRIGINLLIREMIWCNSTKEIGEKLHRFGGGYYRALGKFDEKCQLQQYNKRTQKLEIIKYTPLLPQYPDSIIFDITHDNITNYDKCGNLALNLSMIASVGFSLTAVASTRGFDQLFHYQPSVVKENRTYLYEEFVNDDEEENKKNGHVNSNSKDHTFDYQPPWMAKTVKIAISALNWSTNVILELRGSRWVKTLNLPNGVHYYKYIVDDQWICDNNQEKVKDKAGHENNVVRIGINVHPNIKLYKDLKIIRAEVNNLRKFTSERNNEYFLHQENDYIAVFRLYHDLHSSDNYNGYALISRPVYDKNVKQGIPAKVELPGIISDMLFAATINVPNFDANEIRNHKELLLGVRAEVEFTRSLDYLYKNNKDVLEFTNLLPNAVFLLKIRHNDETRNSLIRIRECIDSLSHMFDIDKIKLSVVDINHILYKCEKEELYLTNGKRGVYDIPSLGKSVYAGISQINQIFQKIKRTKELSHAICTNIRAGDWLFEYLLERIKETKTAGDIYEVLHQVLKHYSTLPTYLKPHYACKVIETLYNLIRYDVIKESKPVLASGEFIQDLLMAVFQFLGDVPQCQARSNISMAAGLIHFCTEYLRCWGRDTFISLKGLLLIPGYFKEARSIILEFASCHRHGLIPNLLDKGNKPRFNARDAAWFFVQSVQDYITLSEEGAEFLNVDVEMLFLDDNQDVHWKKKGNKERKLMKIGEIVNNIFASHARGIEFREWNAGKQIDDQMSDQGFNVKISLDEESGFIFGGNQHNCGTWMDKMGSSEKAKNKGVPATPRDGADVELIGLLYSNLKFFSRLNEEGKYKFDHVTTKSGKNWTYSDWMRKIEENFEKQFYIGKKEDLYTNDQYTDKKLILIEEIYKDVLRPTNRRTEYQLRPNFLIAMGVAPELFNKAHAVRALENVERYLLVTDGLGVRTLSPNDPDYNGDYVSNDDSNNFKLAHGFNYHNGPEWVWLYGYYIRAKINFCEKNLELKRQICGKLIPHMKHIRNNEWQGLPELTNTNNKVCPGSCYTQAWSIATIIDGLTELFKDDVMEEN